MEQTSVCEQSSASFSDDIAGVYDQIIRYRRNVSDNPEESDTPWLRSRLGIVSIASIALILGLFAALKFLPPTVWVWY